MQDLQVYIDIDIVHLPCEIIDLRFVAHRNRAHTISRYHLTPNGLVEMTQDRDFDEVVRAMNKKQGCKVKGGFYKHFAMNTFYITLGNPMYVSHLLLERQGVPMDFSHKINSLMLGETGSHKYYEE
jgi:hypothetical protein